MKKIVRLTESDLIRIVKKVLIEQSVPPISNKPVDPNKPIKTATVIDKDNKNRESIDILEVKPEGDNVKFLYTPSKKIQGVNPKISGAMYKCKTGEFTVMMGRPNDTLDIKPWFKSYCLQKTK